MATKTISADDKEIWEWKEAAVKERKSFSEWARGILNDKAEMVGMRDKKTEKQEKPRIDKPEGVIKSQVVKELEKQSGVEIKLSVPVSTAEEAGVKLEEIVKRKKREDLKRIVEAGKAMEKRYGVG